MKITKRQLKIIIREERARLNYGYPRNKHPMLCEGIMGDLWSKAKSMVGADDDEKVATAVDKIEKEMPQQKTLEELASPDVLKIFKAVAGLGTDEKAVREVINRRRGDLDVLSREFDTFAEELNKARVDIVDNAGDILGGAVKGAMIGAAVVGSVLLLGTIAAMAGVVSMGTTAAVLTTAINSTGAGAVVAGVGGYGAAHVAGGALIGTAVGGGDEALSKILGWANAVLDQGKTLADFLEDDGMDKEAGMVLGALSGKNVQRENKVRITKRQLKRIIREETQGYDWREDESLGHRIGPEDEYEEDERDRRDDSYGRWGRRGEGHHDESDYHQGYDDREDESLGGRHGCRVWR